MKEIATYTGSKIREARKEAGLRQIDVAKVLGYSPMAISHFENGIRNLRLKDIERLAEYFGKRLSYFFPIQSYDNEQKSPEVVASLKRFDEYVEAIDTIDKKD